MPNGFHPGLLTTHEKSPNKEDRKMTNRDFLCWLHERLQQQHGDSELLLHMHRLRRIIATTPKNQEVTQDIRSCDSLEELMETLK